MANERLSYLQEYKRQLANLQVKFKEDKEVLEERLRGWQKLCKHKWQIVKDLFCDMRPTSDCDSRQSWFKYTDGARCTKCGFSRHLTEAEQIKLDKRGY